MPRIKLRAARTMRRELYRCATAAALFLPLTSSIETRIEDGPRRRLPERNKMGSKELFLILITISFVSFETEEEEEERGKEGGREKKPDLLRLSRSWRLLRFSSTTSCCRYGDL